MPRPAIELADIFREHGPAYRAAHAPPRQQLRVMRAIEGCRTAVLGGHIESCSQCDFTRISYHSCRNRHCPKCQNTERAKWLQSRQAELLPVEYFHVVFTIPEEVARIAFYNQETVYGILFRAASEDNLQFFGAIESLQTEAAFLESLMPLRQREWVVYAKPAGVSTHSAFGFLANRFRKEKLALCRQLLHAHQRTFARYGSMPSPPGGAADHAIGWLPKMRSGRLAPRRYPAGVSLAGQAAGFLMTHGRTFRNFSRFALPAFHCRGPLTDAAPPNTAAIFPSFPSLQPAHRQVACSHLPHLSAKSVALRAFLPNRPIQTP